MMINYQEQINAMLSRIEILEQGIQKTAHGFNWKFCPEEVIDRLHKLESMVFHKAAPPTIAARKINLNNRIDTVKGDIAYLYEKLAEYEKEYHEIHECPL